MKVWDREMKAHVRWTAKWRSWRADRELRRYLQVAPPNVRAELLAIMAHRETGGDTMTTMVRDLTTYRTAREQRDLNEAFNRHPEVTTRPLWCSVQR